MIGFGRFLFFLFISLAPAFAFAQQDCFDRSDTCSYSISSLPHQCASCGIDTTPCVVSEFDLLGTVDGLTFYYTLCSRQESGVPDSLQDSLHMGKGLTISIALFEGMKISGTVRKVWEIGASTRDFTLTAPQFVKTRLGTFIHVFMTNGNGGWDMGFYFLRRSGSWYSIDIPDWSQLLKSYLPDHFTLCRGSVIDLDNMSIILPLFKPGDPYCCPTGGSIRAQLDVVDNRFIVKAAIYAPTAVDRLH
ncbi:MAG TPA: hypothetical protein VIS48_04775 [Candidatus Kryptonia bacterium]